MKSSPPPANSVSEYLAAFPPVIRKVLERMRRAIRKAAPEAEETLKYGIPTFVLHENLVHFGGFKQHVGFYPTPSAIKAFEAELAEFARSKGAVQFPLDKPLPVELIEKIVAFRVREAELRSGAKATAARTSAKRTQARKGSARA